MHPGWRQAGIALALTLLWILVLYRDTAMSIVAIWLRSETFTHGFIVPPIVLWLAWRQREALKPVAPVPAMWGLLPFAATAMIWLLGDLSAVQSLTQFALAAFLVLTVLVMLGSSATGLIAFPLAFLFFAVPFGEFMMPQLMDWTAEVTIWALRLSGIPVFREGLRFVIPSGSWSVVEACSGVRYLIASVTVGTLFAYLNYRSTKRRLVFITFSILVPIVANWMRAYMIVMLGHLSSNQLAVGVDHLIYGWLFFGVVILLMFMAGARWAEDPAPALPSRDVAMAQPRQVPPGAIWTAAAGVALLAALPLAAEWNVKRTQVGGTPALSAPATLASDWKRVDPAGAAWQPALLNPSAQTNASYTKDGAIVGLYLGYYRNQDYERKLVSSENVMVRSGDRLWNQLARGSQTAQFGAEQVRVRTAELRFAGGADQVSTESLLVWHLYWINGTLTSSDHLAKLYAAIYRLLGRGDESAVIAISTLRDKADSGDATLASFLAANHSEIDAMLRRTATSK